MNRNDQDPPASATTPVEIDRPAAAGAAPPADGATDRPGAESRSRGSDPPKQSGQPAARHAGDGGTDDSAGATEPATASEIDRSTDA